MDRAVAGRKSRQEEGCAHLAGVKWWDVVESKAQRPSHGLFIYAERHHDVLVRSTQRGCAVTNCNAAAPQRRSVLR